ncbi:MAG TPA: dUTP diphosphatase [Candidatus Lokiarchaeia archaeon]
MSQKKNQNTLKKEKKLLVPFKSLRKGATTPIPSNPDDAGADARIMAFKMINNEKGEKELIELESETYTLKPLERVGCCLGFATAIPKGFYFKVVPRSGLALWDGISIVNSPGTIDAGYRNEWMVIVVNLSNRNVILKKGDRICQIILGKMYEYEFIETEKLPDSERGLGGFGSTGKK